MTLDLFASSTTDRIGSIELKHPLPSPIPLLPAKAPQQHLLTAAHRPRCEARQGGAVELRGGLARRRCGYSGYGGYDYCSGLWVSKILAQEAEPKNAQLMGCCRAHRPTLPKQQAASRANTRNPRPLSLVVLELEEPKLISCCASLGQERHAIHLGGGILMFRGRLGIG